MESFVFVRSDIEKMEVSLGFEDGYVVVMDLKTAIRLRMLLSKKICRLEKVKEVGKS